MRALRFLLLPISAIYSVVVFVRNRLFDLGWLKSTRGALPTIVIGNLTMGGTGKTPHAEYIIRLLKKDFRVASLSRGYGRKSEGFILGSENDDSTTIGDEPFQIHRKFLDVPVAVCEDRLAGIQKLKDTSSTNLIILDDAFQHRKLIGDLNILLIDYNRPFWNDMSFPTGNLRDNVFEKRRADLIILTKCAKNLTPSGMNELRASVNPSSKQSLFFTSLAYCEALQLSGPAISVTEITSVVGFAGLANTETFENHLRDSYSTQKFKKFPDHHIFSQLDIQNLWSECGKFDLSKTVLMTTEKDAMRIGKMKGIEGIVIFYIPIEIYFLAEEEKFKSAILRKFADEKV